MPVVGVSQIFAVMAPADDPQLAAVISAHFPEDHLRIGPGQWLVATVGTSKDVSDQLGVTTGAAGNAIIVAVSGYFGRAPSNIWEWIAAKMGAVKSA